MESRCTTMKIFTTLHICIKQKHSELGHTKTLLETYVNGSIYTSSGTSISLAIDTNKSE
jgi:hypothetical protein